MRLNVLDKINEGDAACFLCRVTLEEYTSSLPSNFEEYFIQRGIVKNKYLDNLWDTISNKKHIPQIVLVSDKEINEENREIIINSESIKILDGLQRSKKLSIIWNTIKFVDNEFEDDTSLSEIRIARKYSQKIKKLECDPKTFRNIISTYRDKKSSKKKLRSLFSENYLWIELWTGLNQDAQIKKMLILNAGHKSVNIKHQIELLFFSYLPLLQKNMRNIEIIREKDKSAITYSKTRQQNSFHFSHLISAFESLNQGKAVTTNSDFSASKSFEETGQDDLEVERIDETLINSFSSTLSKLNKELSEEYGVRWLGREVVLVGIFGAIGAYAQENLDGNIISSLNHFQVRISEFSKDLDLKQFEKERDSVELSQVNIGNVNKKAVYNATLDFLKHENTAPINWGNYFPISKNKADGGQS